MTEKWIDRRGIYDNDYFSGAQAALYIGDVLVDEVTSISFAVNQSRSPLYGYASALFDAVSKGNVIVQGNFTVNFKEAGYLWLVLNRYKRLMKGETPFLDVSEAWFPPTDEALVDQQVPSRVLGERTIGQNIEEIINGEQLPTDIMGAFAAEARLSLSGFSNTERGLSGMGTAENIFEAFENVVWGRPGGTRDIDGGKTVNFSEGGTRRADDPALNPFDIYLTFGDYVGDDRIHHTVHKLKEVYLLGSSKQVVIDGQPIQEAYSFIAKDLV
jgi:hypothetical protein